MTNGSARDTDVLVVGAGPTGLTLAIELQRRGIDCILIEKDDSSVETSRATGSVDESATTDAADEFLGGIAHTCLVVADGDDGPSAAFDGRVLVDEGGTLHDSYRASVMSLFLVRPDDYTGGQKP